MRLPLCALLVTAATLSLEASVPFYNEPEPANFYVDAGFREDNLKVRIGRASLTHRHPGKQPKTRAIMKWRNLKIAQIGASFDYTTHNEYYVRLNADYGRVIDGRGRVSNFDRRLFPFSSSSSSYSSSDFCPCDSSSISSCSCPSTGDFIREYSYQVSDSNNGYVADLLGGVGYKFVSRDGRGWVAGLGGYSFHRQSFEMTKFVQKEDFYDLVGLGPIPGLKGTYLTSWTGPWIGVDFLAKIEYDVTFWGSAEWHWAKYRATGHWNYTDQYRSHIRHHVEGYGAVGRMGIDWTPCDRWAFGVSGDYQIWSTRPKGRNRASATNDLPPGDFAELTFPVVEKSRLRRVRWNSYTLAANVSYRF